MICPSIHRYAPRSSPAVKVLSCHSDTGNVETDRDSLLLSHFPSQWSGERREILSRITSREMLSYIWRESSGLSLLGEGEGQAEGEHGGLLSMLASTAHSLQDVPPDGQSQGRMKAMSVAPVRQSNLGIIGNTCIWNPKAFIRKPCCGERQRQFHTSRILLLFFFFLKSLAHSMVSFVWVCLSPTGSAYLLTMETCQVFSFPEELP